MTFRESWKADPQFRRSIIGSLFGGAFGFGVARLEKLTHFPLVILMSAGAIAASVYIGWSLRKMEKERLALVKREHEMMREMIDYSRRCEEEIRAAIKRQEGGEEGKVWLQ